MSDTKLDKIDSKIDKLQDKLSSIDVTLAAQHVSLKEHIRRTELLEHQVSPMVRRDIMILGVLKVIAFSGIVIGIIEGYLKIKNG